MKKAQKKRTLGISVILLLFALMTSGCDLLDFEPNYPKNDYPQVQIGYFVMHNNYASNPKYDLTIFFSLWDSKGEQLFNKTRVSVGRDYDCGSFFEGTYYIEIYEYQNNISTNPRIEKDSGYFRINGGVKYDLYYPGWN